MSDNTEKQKPPMTMEEIHRQQDEATKRRIKPAKRGPDNGSEQKMQVYEDYN